MATTILPDVRYASSYLDKKYKNYAEYGEVVMDKITGEILLKRKIDGKLISFVQNDKYIHDLMVELRILLNNNTTYTYPTADEAWLVSSDFNITDINNNTFTDLISEDSITFSNNSSDEKFNFRFYVSAESNGFFIRPISRDTDKNMVEYLTEYYDLIFQNYDGTNSTYLTEKAKFSSNSTYENTNCEVVYSIEITGTNSNGEELTQTYSSSKNVRINEYTLVSFPTRYKSSFSTVSSIRVTISKLGFYKFGMAKTYMEDVEGDVTDTYNKLVAPDGQIVIENVNILEFVDNDETIPANDYIVNIALMSAPNVMTYIGYIDKLASNAGFIVQVERPNDNLWTINNAWGEMVRYVYSAGQSVTTDHETDLTALEEYIYATEGLNVNFTFDENDLNDIFIEVIG